MHHDERMTKDHAGSTAAAAAAETSSDGDADSDGARGKMERRSWFSPSFPSSPSTYSEQSGPRTQAHLSRFHDNDALFKLLSHILLILIMLPAIYTHTDTHTLCSHGECLIACMHAYHGSMMFANEGCSGKERRREG